MPTDHIRYDIMAQEALREMVRKVLADVAKSGLKGDHHFSITFMTGAQGVRIPARLRDQYPQDMTIVLQYQFWDLKVGTDSFDVGLSFGGVPERLTVPFAAITSFVDPSVQFALQFQTIPDSEAPTPAATPKVELAPARPTPKPLAKPRRPTKPASAPAVAAKPSPPSPPAAATPEPEKSGAEVVRLDRFRKK